jgi:hypothetical protein
MYSLNQKEKGTKNLSKLNRSSQHPNALKDYYLITFRKSKKEKGKKNEKRTMQQLHEFSTRRNN